MASNTLGRSLEEMLATRDDSQPIKAHIARWLLPLASLKLTVALLAMSIFLVFAGTLAQTEKDIWQVMELYFRTGVAWIDCQVFFPRSWFPDQPVPAGRFWFPFPGGWMIGTAMIVNLLAAHGLRFKVQASGTRLAVGLATIAAGVALTAVVVSLGSDKEGFVGMSTDWAALWKYCKLALAGVCVIIAYGLWRLDRSQKLERAALTVLGLGLMALLGWLLYQGDAAALGGPSLRILWQLAKGWFAGLVLLAGCILVFRKRAGIVLLHAGVGLMMANELVVYSLHSEGQMQILEGETVNFGMDIRTLELAVVDRSDRKEDDVIVIPKSILLAGETIKHEDLPFDVRVVKFIENSQLVEANRMLAAIVPQGSKLWFFKLVGPKDAVPPHAEAFTQFLETIRFGKGDAGKGDDANPQWTAPRGWVELGPSEMRYTTFKIGAEDSAVELSVVALPNPAYQQKEPAEKLAAAVLSNINRWRDQLNLSPIDKDQLGAQSQPIELAGVPATVVDLEGQISQGENLATAGAGLRIGVKEQKRAVGTESKVDVGAAYVRLFEKGTDKTLGTYLTSLELLPQKIDVGGKFYEVALRFKRDYKPYSVYLSDVRFDKYLGTAKAKNYSSDIRLVDEPRSVDRTAKIWMNNPLRYAGETFYQSSYSQNKKGEEATTLQVVTNAGWMIPYVGCMIVAIGMLTQFSTTLVRFLNRMQGGPDSAAGPRAPAAPRSAHRPAKKRAVAAAPGKSTSIWKTVGVSLGVVLFSAGWVMKDARLPHPPAGQMRLDEFGRLPLVYQGRVKPFDTLARNSLCAISERETYEEEKEEDDTRSMIRRLLDRISRKDDSQPAIRWLMDVISHSDAYRTRKVFRIDNFEVLETLKLPRRKGLRYSIEEMRPEFAELQKQVALAQSLEPVMLSVYQKKILQLHKRIGVVMLLAEAFDEPRIRLDEKHLKADLMEVIHEQDALARKEPPLAIPSEASDGHWEPYSAAYTRAIASQFVNQKPNPATLAMNAMLVSYRKGDAQAFNGELAKYQAALAEAPPKDVNLAKINFETFFNHLAPFYHAEALYVFAFVLVALSWLVWRKPLNWASFWLIAFTLALHTFAVVSRIYISGRPPVTNLYSSAVFIGWAGVLLGLLLEVVFKLGIGNVIASVSGFLTLLIAYFLSREGDTFIVLQAVLDTQFWLATHVVCVTLGYATTYVAGLLGIIYILRGVVTRSLTADVSKALARMIYAIVCFAIFFSFVGTVLGGLWADDSWGRFWGWDPKENGALIIVLWNALVLHARWGGLAKERGLAVLAVVGNIVTSWSWFGVNELGVGLHSYGFTEGVMKALALFVASQLVIIALGCLPRRYWRSRPPDDGPTQPEAAVRFGV